MYFDGALNHDGAGAGVLFISPKGEQLKYVLQLLFKATNNTTEYEALIHGLRIAVTLGIKCLLAYGDSKVVIQQVNKDWCKDRWTKRGGELGLFQFLKQSKATLTYAMLVGHQFTNRITKLPTQAKRDKTRSKA